MDNKTKTGVEMHLRFFDTLRREEGITHFSLRRLTSRLKSSSSNSESLSLLMYELLKELFRLGRDALCVESGVKTWPGSLGPLAAWAAGGALCSSARLTENLPTRASGSVVT